MQDITKTAPNNEEHLSEELPPRYVSAAVISRKYNITTRFVLAMAADGRLPCLRIGKRTVRFSENAVAATFHLGK